MKIINIKATNFLSISELDLNLDNLGLALIYGKNIDDDSASGAGKTAVLDAISFALFGASPRGIKADAFIQRGKKSCSVTVDIALEADKTLSITRTRKPEDLFYVMDGETKRGTSIKETQKDLEDLLKLDFNTFLNSIYFSQETSKFFISSTDSEKVEILTKVLDLSLFDKLQENAKAENKELEVQLEDKRREASGNYEVIHTMEQAVEDAKTKDLEFKTGLEEEIKRTLAEIPAINAKIDQIKEVVLKYKDKKYDFLSIHQPTKPDWRLMDGEIEREEKAIADLKAQEKATEPTVPDTIIQSQKTIEEKKVKLAKLEEEYRKVELEADKAKFKITNHLNDNATQIRKIKATGEGICPHCFNVVSKEHLAKVIEDIKADTTKFEHGLELLKVRTDQQLKPLLEAQMNVKDEIEVEEENLKEMTRQFEFKLQEFKEKEASRSQDIIYHMGKLSSAKAERQRIESEYQRALDAYNNKIHNLEQVKQNDIDYVKQQIENIKILQNQRDQVTDRVEEIKNKQSPFTDMIEKYTNQLIAKRQEDTAVTNEIDDLMQRIDDMTTLRKCYKDVKMYIFESTVDEMNVRINKYLSPLFNEDINISFKYKMTATSCKFDTEIIKNGQVAPFSSLSSGEKVRCEIATNFALSDIVSMRKSSSLNFLILDEVANGMCATGKERLVHLLELLKDEKDTILVIDHFPTMESIIDNKIIVTKQNNISTIGVE